MEIASWFVMIAAMIGCILNVQRKKSSLVIWTFTNFFWVVYDFTIEAYAQSILFFICAIISIWGIVQWSKEDKNIMGDRRGNNEEDADFRSKNTR